MLAEILCSQFMSPKVALHAAKTVTPQGPIKNQTVESRQRAAQLVPIPSDKIVHGCFPPVDVCLHNNIVRERETPLLVVAMPLCGAGNLACRRLSGGANRQTFRRV